MNTNLVAKEIKHIVGNGSSPLCRKENNGGHLARTSLFYKWAFVAIMALVSFATAHADTLITSLDQLSAGDTIRIYPRGDDDINHTLACSEDGGYLKWRERAGDGEEWTLEDAGDGLYYLKNEFGCYWAYQNDSTNVSLTCTTDKGSAVKVKLTWNSDKGGVCFWNQEDGKGLYGYGYGNVYNWYSSSSDNDSYATVFSVYSKLTDADCLEIDGICYRLNMSDKTAEVYTRNKYIPENVGIPEYVEYDNERYLVTSLHDNCFIYCDIPTNIILPNSITSLRNGCFAYCSSLTSISLSNNITSLPMDCFTGCSSLASITIPSSVTDISFAFLGCSGLTEVTLKGNTLPTCGTAVFNGLPSDATLYCKSSLVETCKNTAPWSNFKNIVAWPSLTITSAGIATACFDEDLDFSEVADVKAYIASGYSPKEGKVLLTRATHIPAGTGFIVKGSTGEYEIPVSATDYTYANLLVGTLEETSLSAADGSYSNYVLRNDATLGVGFHTPVDGYVLPANKAYLRIPTSASEAKSVIGLCFDGEDDTTGFIPVRKLKEGTNGQSAVYDLNGQRKQGLSKGLNIVDGKKILVK